LTSGTSDIPTRKILAGDIVRGEWGFCRWKDGVAAAFTLNDRCDAAYALGAWRLPRRGIA
jgi:hypothetical protein